MNVQVKIPDEVFNHENSNISRQVLEAVALEGFKAKQMTTAQVKRLLGFNTRLEVYEFLATNGVPWVNYSVEDAERERQLLDKILS
jgi:hypothetical protein